MTYQSDMALLPAHSYPMLGIRCATLRGNLYCSISERLRQSATQAAEAFAALTKQRDLGDFTQAICYVYYRTRRATERSARTLNTLRLQGRNGASGAAAARPALVDSGGTRLHCTVDEYLANEDAFRALASDLAVQDTGAVVKVDKQLKKLAQAYTELFDPSRIEDVRLSIAGGIGDSSWRKDVLTSHGVIMDFLRLFVSLCSSERQVERDTNHPEHVVGIQDVSIIVVDGIVMNFIAARKAALFTLAALGTNNVSVETFARLYDNYLTGNTRLANYGNIFAQAMQGLRKSLVDVSVIKVRPYYRSVAGLTIHSNISPDELKGWLRGRRQKLDPAL